MHEVAPGQAVNLLRVAAEGSVDMGIRQQGVIAFKNLIKKSWDVQEKSEAHQISAEDQAVVRSNLFEALVRVPHTIQTQLGEVFRTVVYNDYPEKWPGLLPELCTNLASQDPQRVQGSLYALRILARKYEFRDEDERQPLAQLVSTVFPGLLQILQQLVSNPNQASPEVCLCTRLIWKTFWSATYMGIPDLLTQPDTMNGWLTALLMSLSQTPPPETESLPREERPASPWWKSRKWIMSIAYRLLSRYGEPRHCKEGNDKVFGELFKRNWSLRLLDAQVALVARLAAGQYLSPRVTNSLFQYLAYALDVKECYKHMQEHWDALLLNVAFPMMCFSDEDMELWTDDPHEYIRKGYDILEDMFSPKTSVANFAHDLCAKRRTHLDKFMAAMVALMQQYMATAAATNNAGVPVDLARRADGALLAIGVMGDILKEKKPYKQELGGMLASLVAPCLSSTYGHLRAKAAWVIGQYIDVQFPDGKCQGPTFNMFFHKVVALLGDPELPVRVDAVVSLRHIIDAAEEVESLKPVLPVLLNSIFQLMGELDAEDLVFSLEALVDKFGPEISPYAGEMVKQLAAAFAKYSTESDNNDEDEDDQAGMAAYGCLRAINTLLESVAALGPALFPELEASLYPLICSLVSPQGMEIDTVEEVLEMLAYLSYYGPGISDALWSLWPRLHTMLVEWGIQYWENLLVPLDNMITRDTARFVSSKDPDYLTSVFQMVQYSLQGDYEEAEVAPAAKLLQVVLQACRGMVDTWVGPYVGLVLQKLATCQSRTLKDNLVLVVANALYYNPVLTLQVLQAQGAVGQFLGGWFSMIMAAKPSGKPKHFKRMQDKKVCVLGLLSMISCPAESLPAEVVSSEALIMAGVAKLLVGLKEQEEENARQAQASEEGSEAEEGSDEEAEEDNEEEEPEKEDEYLKRLKKSADDLLGRHDDGDESDDDWFDDEEESLQTPLDSIDPYIMLADTLAALQVHSPARHQAIVGGSDAGVQAALQGLLTLSVEKRQKLAQRQVAG